MVGPNPWLFFRGLPTQYLPFRYHFNNHTIFYYFNMFTPPKNTCIDPFIHPILHATNLQLFNQCIRYSIYSTYTPLKLSIYTAISLALYFSFHILFTLPYIIGRSSYRNLPQSLIDSHATSSQPRHSPTKTFPASSAPDSSNTNPKYLNTEKCFNFFPPSLTRT